jgi:hypothetical protein
MPSIAVAGMPTLQSASESVRDLVDRVLGVPDEALSIAEFALADWKVRLRSTCPKVTNLYSERLRSRKPLAVESAACLTFNLFETSVLGWAPLESYSDWRGQLGHFELILKTLRFRGVYPDATEGDAGTEPCTIFDPDRQVGMQLVTSIRDLPPWDAGSPCRIPLNLAAVGRGWFLVHAGTLSLADDGVLIVGPGGSGKSGTTLAGISTGLKTAGDDYVLVCPSSPPTAFRVYNVLKLERNRFARIAGLAADTANRKTNWQNKLELDPEELFPESVVERVRLRAILAPEFAYTRQTLFLPVDPQHAFHRLAPSLWAQLPGARASGFRFATWLTRSLPTYSVQLSDEPAEIGDSIGRFIAGLTT